MNLQSQRHLVIVCFQRLDSGFGFSSFDWFGRAELVIPDRSFKREASARKPSKKPSPWAP